MAKVSDILAGKSDAVHRITETASVLEATRHMNNQRIGALLITDGADQVVGIFTERDVLRRVVAEQRDPAGTVVAKVMTTELVCCRPHTDLEEVRSLMKQQRIRHLPVIDDGGQLHGMISIGDVNAHFARDSAVQAHYMNEYILGRT
jgi:CBS domain-containing protein